MDIEIMKLKKLAEGCTRNEPVFCSNACPFNLDVKMLLKKIRNGNVNAAYNLFKRTVLFPLIVSELCNEPCASVCPWNMAGSSVPLKKIERSCCEYNTKKAGAKFYIPAKEKKIAIIGAGLGGLSCALKLSGKGYPVTLYEKETQIGGTIFEHITPSLSEEMIKSDLDGIMDEDISFVMDNEIKSLEDLSYDAIFVATGRYGSKFDLKNKYPQNSLATDSYGVFMTTGDETKGVLNSLREGILAAVEIEGFLKTGKIEQNEGIYGTGKSNFKINTDKLSTAATECEKTASLLTEEEMRREAQRCDICDCTDCMDNCKLLNKYKKYPDKVAEDVNATLNVMKGFTTRLASRQINSCNLCGHCSEKCVSDFDFREIFLESRRQMHRTGSIPPVYHDFWMRDLEHALSDDAYLALSPREGSCNYLFFPGCQLGCSDPEYVIRAYNYLEEQLGNTGIILGCCGAPAYWAGDEMKHKEIRDSILQEWKNMGKPAVITACPTCMKLLSEIDEINDICSIYEIMAQYGIDDDKGNKQSYAVFDPCAASKNKEMQAAVRHILKKAGISFAEFDNHGKYAQCCGYGGHIHAVDRELMEEVIDSRITANEEDYITYCVNCRDSFAEAGKRTVHILDLLWAEGFEERKTRRLPSLSQRRENRIRTKKMMEKVFGIMEETKKKKVERLVINVDNTLIEKMNKNLILMEDAEAVITHCEETGEKLLNQQSGNFIGHLQNGYITYWVEYRYTENGIELINIYCHRMQVQES